MSSNIRLLKICQSCGNEFEARKTTSRTCSDSCAKRLYKQKQREHKIEAVQAATKQLKEKPIEDLKSKAFLTVPEAAKLLNCTPRTMYRLIEKGTIHAFNFSDRKTTVRRSDIDTLFEQPRPVQVEKEPEVLSFEGKDHYTIEEVKKRYKISESALHQLINRNNINRHKIGWYTYVPKAAIDKLFT